MKYSEKISNQLNELLVKNYDAEKGYRNAIENVDSSDLKIFFTNRANERETFAEEIKTEINRYNETPKENGSFTGTMHRNWMSLKSTFSTNNEEAILEEAIRGEEASLEDYNDVLSDRDLPPTIDTMLTKHRDAIQASINTVKVKEELVS
ncbi:PA2169 family four-helix-bundle protein [Winogradskyella maritima]|uniref:PA2169 family four-helix-bundle protein n=1 Tax=Winogradskyella maritima TaxID=1517766 RepID=A0ABV8AFW8_9FLAO|nr:PA2169 family four-helix-bundle protein [Winogradskyella maritima]